MSLLGVLSPVLHTLLPLYFEEIWKQEDALKVDFQDLLSQHLPTCLEDLASFSCMNRDCRPLSLDAGWLMTNCSLLLKLTPQVLGRLAGLVATTLSGYFIGGENEAQKTFSDLENDRIGPHF